jgi:hypothetical protein
MALASNKDANTKDADKTYFCCEKEQASFL